MNDIIIFDVRVEVWFTTKVVVRVRIRDRKPKSGKQLKAIELKPLISAIRNFE